MATPADDSSAHLTSPSLLQRARGRDEEAWCRLYQLYRPFVLYWCGRWGVQEGEREDVTQEVFRSVMAGLDAFRRDRPGDSFRGWLRGVTRNMVLQHFRRARDRAQAEGGTAMIEQLNQVAAPADEDDPADQISELYRRALDLVRGEFEDRSWQMFWLTVIESRPSSDVAALLGVSPAAVRQAKSRVLRRLKEETGDLLD